MDAGIASRYAVRRIRLNSIYDVLSSRAFAADADPVIADAADGTVQTPMWRNYYASCWRYWTVLGCKYRISFRQLNPDVSSSVEYYIYEHGRQCPPETNIAGNAILGWQYRRLHPNLKAHGLIKQAPTILPLLFKIT